MHFVNCKRNNFLHVFQVNSGVPASFNSATEKTC